MPRRPARAADAAAHAVAERLHAAAIHLLRAVRRADVEAGLTPSRLSALSVIVFAGPLTLGELAAAEQVRPPTITRLVTALEARGLVARVPDAADGRVVRLRATRAGRSLLLRARGRRLAMLVRRMRRLSDADLALLDRAAAIVERLAASE